MFLSLTLGSYPKCPSIFSWPFWYLNVMCDVAGCTIAASATHLFAFRCLAPASGFYSDFRLLRVDPLRGTATETLRRRASFVRAFTAAEDVQYWFEESTSAIVPRLRSSE